jgi:hypothetical protein
MALRPLNSIAGFSTGDPAVTIIQANGDINTINFTANGLVNLGNVGNVNIAGGSNGQYLKTDGAGNLNWDSIGNISSNRAAPMPYLIPTGESYIVNENFQGLYSQAITIDGELEVDGILIEVPISFGAEPTQILFAENGSPAGNSHFTFDRISGDIIAPGDILPHSNVTQNLGSSDKRWNDIWLSNSTIYIGNSTISTDANGLVLTSGSGATFEVSGNANVSTLQNGNSNISIDTNANITFGVAGVPNVLVISSNGIGFTGNIDFGGNVDVTGNIAPGGIKTDNYYYANGAPVDFQQAAGSNTQIQFNSNNDFGASANLTFNTSTNVLAVGGNITAGNVSGGNLVSANFVSGTLTTASQPNITSVGTLGSLAVTANVVAGNVYSNSGTIGANLLTGTLTTTSQPNITSLGTLTTLETSGNAIIGGNLFVNGNITYINVDTIQVEDPIIVIGGGPNGAPLTTNDGKDRGTLLQYYTSAPVSAFMGWDNSNGEFAFGSNVTESSDVITFTALGNVRASTYLGNISGVTGNFSGNISAANASLGNIANANYLVSNSGCVSVAGAFIAVSAGTGGIFNSGVTDINFGLAANVTMGSTTGNVTARGNLIANNISITGNISANLITGTLTTAAQANITTVGTLGNLTVSGNTVSNIVDANTTQTQSIISKRSNVAVTTLTVIDSFATSAYRTAKYVVSSQNDDGFESLEVLLIHNDINSYITVYGAINDGGGNTVTMSTGINSGNVELRATGLAGNTVVKLIGTYVPD